MTKKRTNLLPIILLLVVAACAGLTPAQKTLWSLNVYEAQYNAYLDAVINPELSAEVRDALKKHPEEITGNKINPKLTEDQRKILRVKKDILVELQPLIIMAAEYQRTGNLPSDDVQKKMTELINRLVELAEN